MSHVLLLPGCPTARPELPAEQATLDCTELPALSDLAALHAYFAELPEQVALLLGSDQTPPLLWLLAIETYPGAQRQYFCHQQQAWQTLTPPRATSPAKPQPAAAVPHTRFAACSDIELLQQAFRFAAWGYQEEHNHRQLEEIALEALQRAATQKGLAHRVAKARQSGERAFHLSETLKSRLARQLPDNEAWITEVTAGEHSQVARHLHITLNKHTKRQGQQQQRQAAGRSFTSTLPAVMLCDGRHPNSLRHLAAAPNWHVLIDETGLRFDASASQLGSNDKELGRLVALAIPEGQVLPPLPGFHACEATAVEVDKVLQQVLQRPLGIFGFTVQDPALQSLGWIAHIQQLLRWVLLQLPVQPDQGLRVTALIEQRSGYQNSQTLQTLGEVLENECKRLDPLRFADLQLSLAFINKQHPLVGYVDAIAYTWGSPAAESVDRLKKSALLGHCLLRPSDSALERLYMALNAHYRLPANDWYALCAATLKEPAGGLLASFLERLGALVRQQPALWQNYLADVRQRFQRKDFRLAELGQALNWLEYWTPTNQALPANLRLPLETARLAADNHRGLVNHERISRCLTLSRQLYDEDAVEACSAILRLASTTTNTFEFETLLPVIQQWLHEAVAVPGLLNHAKLHSALGQLLAFAGELQQAQGHFAQARTAFSRLSDSTQAEREIAQTRSYGLFVQLAQDDPQAVDALCQHLQTLIGKHDQQAISRSLAYDKHTLRHAHHLWLRGLVTFPQQMAPAREAYLAQSQQWQRADEHPWPLINAYRAWLLHDSGQHSSASACLEQAIRDCASSDNGPVLHWMAEVLRTLGASLEIPLARGPSADERACLQQLLPRAPHAALQHFAQTCLHTHQARLEALRACLPFNFH